MLRGYKVQDDSGVRAVFTEQVSGASQLTAMDALDKLPMQCQFISKKKEDAPRLI